VSITVPPPRVPAARPVFSPQDRQRILALIDESLQSGSLTLGPNNQALEEDFRLRHQAPFAVATSSGTSALEIVLRTLDLGGAEVVVPTNTFFATAAAVVAAGGRLRLADVAADTLSLSTSALSDAITPSTAAVIVVHIGGFISPEIDSIRALCDQHDLALIEDAAHAHGSSYDGRPAGSFGRAGAFSFYPTKVMTSGEGGMIVTADWQIRDEALIYRDQGKAGFLGGEHVRMGYAWRMSELHAAVGRVQLSQLDDFIAARQRAATIYDEALSGVDNIALLPRPAACSSNYYKYIALLGPGVRREVVKARLREEYGVALSGEVYSQPLHRQPVLAATSHGEFPIADDVCNRHICLPIHSDMRSEEATYVAESLKAVLACTGGSANL
jgi:dTDP-4-amino-4,6-dideoxygalactose transaminase